MSGLFTPRKPDLWPEQQRTFDEVRERIAQGMKRMILAGPTGFGKTELAIALMLAYLELGWRTLFVCDRIPLTDQGSNRLDKYGVPHGVIQAQHWRWQPHQPIQVASSQTLESRAEWVPADLVFVDEAHTLRRKFLERVRRLDAVVLGLSATPFTKGLKEFYPDGVITAATHNALTEAGRLTTHRVFAPSEPDMTGARTNNFGEWSDREVERRAIPIVGDCVREYMRHAEGRKFIAFGSTIAHCEALARQFMAAGIHCATYCANTPAAERKTIVDEFKKPNSFIRGLVSVAALSRGFDQADVSCVIIARPLRKSLSEHIQCLGRGLRAAPGKEDCIVLDHAGNMMRFWEPMQDFFEYGVDELDDGKAKKKRAQKKDERPPKKCPQCHHVHPPRKHCPECGFEYPARQNAIQHEAGELRELVGAGVEPGIERQELFSQLIAIQLERGRQFGWVKHSFKEKVGVWPRGYAEVPAEPTSALRRWVKSRDIAYAKAMQKRGRAA